jgi:predicted nucleic acid-binding protein
MIVLDTNVLSALMRASLAPAVTAWLNIQPPATIWTTSVSIFEIQFGLCTMPTGKNQRALQLAFADVLEQDLTNRILGFDVAAAQQAAEIASKLQSIGRRGEIRDLMIAGIVSAHGATLATRNTKDFTNAGISLTDSWQADPQKP